MSAHARVDGRRQDVEYKERRRGPRYPFIASAELIEQKADVRIASRVSELSLNGCYLDMMNPFPQGTMVLVKISAGEDFFQAKGKIVYSQINRKSRSKNPRNLGLFDPRGVNFRGGRTVPA